VEVGGEVWLVTCDSFLVCAQGSTQSSSHVKLNRRGKDFRSVPKLQPQHSTSHSTEVLSDMETVSRWMPRTAMNVDDTHVRVYVYVQCVDPMESL
jgi:hypothetical protein